MVSDPDALLSRYVEAGCEWVIVHAEAPIHLHRSLDAINEAGGKAAVALNPATPASAVAHVHDLVDLLLVMTVNPGFGGQSLIPATLDKVRRAREMLDRLGARAELEVDGGIKPDNVGELVGAGARVVVVGSAIFVGGAGIAGNVASLRERLG